LDHGTEQVLNGSLRLRLERSRMVCLLREIVRHRVLHDLPQQIHFLEQLIEAIALRPAEVAMQPDVAFERERHLRPSIDFQRGNNLGIDLRYVINELIGGQR
jgi:hypothetical protein